MLAVRAAAGALDFYKAAFGATEKTRLTAPDGKIVHSEIKIGAAQVMVADEYPGENVTPDALGVSSVIVHLFVSDMDALFERAIAAGATLLRPVADQFTGTRNGKLRDPFGHVWLIQTCKENVAPDEVTRRAAALLGGR